MLADFSHCFIVFSETIIFYKVNNFYQPCNEVGFIFNDKDLNIDWKLSVNQIQLSDKDKILGSFADYSASL